MAVVVVVGEVEGENDARVDHNVQDVDHRDIVEADDDAGVAVVVKPAAVADGNNHVHQEDYAETE